MNYTDDLKYIGLPSKIHESYHKLLSRLDEQCLEVSQLKFVPPSTSVVCLGIQVDTINHTLYIPPWQISRHFQTIILVRLIFFSTNLKYFTTCSYCFDPTRQLAIGDVIFSTMLLPLSLNGLRPYKINHKSVSLHCRI